MYNIECFCLLECVYIYLLLHLWNLFCMTIMVKIINSFKPVKSSMKWKFYFLYSCNGWCIFYPLGALPIFVLTWFNNFITLTRFWINPGIICGPLLKSVKLQVVTENETDSHPVCILVSVFYVEDVSPSGPSTVMGMVVVHSQCVRNSERGNMSQVSPGYCD